MKILFKILSFFVLLDFMVMIGFLGWFSYSVVIPAMKDTGISLNELFKKELEYEKYNKLQENMSLKSKKLGKETAEKIADVVEKLFISDHSKTLEVEYPYISVKSIDNMFKMYEKRYHESFKQGLKYLENID